MRRILGIVLAFVLIGGVITAVVLGRGDSEANDTTTVRGVIGSEKAEFFEDEKVRDALADKGYIVETESAGSWDMEGLDLAGDDFAFPGSSAPADALQRAHKTTGAPLRPFYSPLVVLTRRSAAEALAANGLATLTGTAGKTSGTSGTSGTSQQGSGTLRMEPFLKAAAKDTTWQDLKGTKGHADLSGTVFVTSTDPLASNSGALYLATASYVANGNRLVTDDKGVAASTPLTRKLTVVQGRQQTNSDAPFRDFVSGVGTPLVLAYESQIASLLVRGDTVEDLVVLYPDTTVYSDHSLVPLTAEGKKFGELLRTDPELRKLAVRHGFRPAGDTSEFAAATAGHGAYLRQKLTGTVQQAPVPTVEVMRDIARRSRAEK
ncbi:hypothetical protein [Streptomyces zagrosensis]|uniref:Solute-binding protein n=1 Tax=Streptomyces zagrosensis TaxID=1042984 RepID=A0A7W9QDF9_9ACTN|nr:hypothetical protein [Streptomyces zagrosensis]MBB5938230.1 hypothetical protein [Streptomyces zagrosensis]